MIKIGFTGTRRGMSDRQQQALVKHFGGILGEKFELHHGDCIGADAEAGRLTALSKGRIVIHPPKNEKLRAFSAGDKVLRPLDYIKRNRRIVDATDYLIAAPHRMTEEIRSGTWSTIRYAETMGREVIVLGR